MNADCILDRWTVYLVNGRKCVMSADTAKHVASTYYESIQYVECFDTPIMVTAKREAEELFWATWD